MTTTEVEVIIKGEAAKALDQLQHITNKPEPVDVIISALRIYEWILAQQTKGNIIAAVSKNGSVQIKQELVDYVNDKDAAYYFFKGRDIFEG